MDQIKVSVLIPVYGVEKYIERCARSLFDQTMKDGIEFIFTNDCTKDRSIEILNQVLTEYPNRRHQVRIINHDTNQGLAVARVTGVKAARGEYVIHCDSDDWVEPDMYELMYAKAKETDADIVGCDFFEEIYEHSKKIKQNFFLRNKEASLAILNSNSGLDSYLWCRMVKREFYINNNFYAPAHVSIFEDLVVTLPMHLFATKCTKVEKTLYHYRRWSGGMTHKSTVQGIISALNAIRFIRGLCTMDSDLFQAYQRRFLNMAQALITQVNTYEPDLWREETKDFPSESFGVLKHQISPWLVRHKLDTINLILVRIYRHYTTI